MTNDELTIDPRLLFKSRIFTIMHRRAAVAR